MMGRLDSSQDRFFYDFSLDDVVPPDHLVRRIDAVLDFDWLRTELRPYYSPYWSPFQCISIRYPISLSILKEIGYYLVNYL